MGVAIDSVAAFITATSNASFIAATPANGDSFTVRSFPSANWAKLEAITYDAKTLGKLRLRSPMLHDDVRGIEITPGEAPARFLLPREVGQPLVSQDTLVVEMQQDNGDTAAQTDVAVLSIYYQNLPGSSARLHKWGDISGIIKNIKPLEVDVAAPAAAGQWADTVITTTENLLHANTDYAVLGYVTNQPVAAVGIRGQETGNLRITGPGTIDTLGTSDYFVRMDQLHGTPHIPVFNSANKDSFYVSLIESSAVAGATVQLILAELKQNLTS